MAIGRVGRIGRVARVGAGGLGPDAAHTILTITDSVASPGNALVTTAGQHGLIGGEFVNISGSSVAGYNGGPFEVFVDDATHFTLGTGYISDATGGTWALA